MARPSKLTKFTYQPASLAVDRQLAEKRLDSARVMARAWGLTVPERQRQQAAWAFIHAAIERYAETAAARRGLPIALTPPPLASRVKLQSPVIQLAHAVGDEVADLSIEHAAFQLSATYTALVPASVRSTFGMYYTPPALTGRLLDLAEQEGIDWTTARVLDPACGGGAFLLPVALRMRKALASKPAAEQFRSIVSRLRGFEIDPFAAWLTQTWLEIALLDLSIAAGKELPPVVEVCDTLQQEPDAILYNLVIGNPPYGRVSLDPEQRTKFARGLYGHANLYGVFTDIALRWTQLGGTIAYVTPTSFLSGQYFKALRSLLSTQAPPTQIDFIAARSGVFEDVLQETLLATYRRGAKAKPVTVHHLDATQTESRLADIGTFRLPKDGSDPWLAPRNEAHTDLFQHAQSLTARLKDWGYIVSTGPLVWNRFKPQLRDRTAKGCYPIIWAEAITGSGFSFRAELRNHQPYFAARPQDDWLKVTEACVLVQRTTAKEQPRRLIAAELPASFIEANGAVIVENHLNMVRARRGSKAKVDAATLAAVLNSRVVDDLFRCISGSVAVSAYELEAVPLPKASALASVAKLVHARAPQEDVEAAITLAFLGKDAS